MCCAEYRVVQQNREFLTLSTSVLDSSGKKNLSISYDTRLSSHCNNDVPKQTKKMVHVKWSVTFGMGLAKVHCQRSQVLQVHHVQLGLDVGRQQPHLTRPGMNRRGTALCTAKIPDSSDLSLSFISIDRKEVSCGRGRIRRCPNEYE